MVSSSSDRLSSNNDDVVAVVSVKDGDFVDGCGESEAEDVVAVGRQVPLSTEDILVCENSWHQTLTSW